MIPIIDRRATGVNIRRIMDRKNISVKDLQHYLGLGSIQSIYHWLNGICLPSLDNLYAMSRYFQLPLDDLICGTGIQVSLICGSDHRVCPANHVKRPGFIFWDFLALTYLAVRAQRRTENYCG